MVAAFALAFPRLGGCTNHVLAAKASGVNVVIVRILGVFAHRCTAKRDAYIGNIRTGGIGNGDVPFNEYRTTHIG
jgi:hypothetical protein